MTVKFAPLLCVAALVLSACGTVEDETPQTSVTSSMPVQKRVVHGPIVPDEPVRAAKRKRTYAASHSSSRRHVAVAPSTTTPTRVEPVETAPAETTAPVTSAPTTPSTSAIAPATTADATAPSTTTAPTTPSTDATVTTPAPVTTETLPAPTDTTQPVEPTPVGESSQPLLPGLDPARLPELLQMQFAGLPVWLIGLVGLVLVVALAIGFGGRREVEEPI